MINKPLPKRQGPRPICQNGSKFFLFFSLASADNDGMLRVSLEKKGLVMSPDGTYNGYANYQTWNVCLWISNDEYLSNIACRSANYAEFKDNMRLALYSAYRKGIGYETPDGVAWNDSGVNLAEMQEFWNDNFCKVAA